MKNNSSPFLIFRAVVLPAFLFVVTGCSTPTAEVKSFGTSAASLSTAAKDGYNRLNDTVIEYRMVHIASHPDEKFTEDTFAPVLEGQNLTVRLKLLQDLSDYATSLQNLSTKEFTDVDSNSKNLDSSLTSLSSDYKTATGSSLGISTGDIKILSTIVAAAGDAYVDWKRRQAVEKIVLKADPAVQKASIYIKSELADNIGPAVARELENIYGEMGHDFNNGGVPRDFGPRLDMLKSIQAADTNAKTAGPLYTSIGEAAEKMGKAHATLAQTVSSGKWTSAALKQDVSDFATYVTNVKSFYQSLK